MDIQLFENGSITSDNITTSNITTDCINLNIGNDRSLSVYEDLNTRATYKDPWIIIIHNYVNRFYQIFLLYKTNYTNILILFQEI